MKKNNIKFFLFISFVVIASSFLFISLMIDKGGLNNLRVLFSVEERAAVKKYILPYKVISTQKLAISNLNELTQSLTKNFIELELQFKESNGHIQTKQSNLKLSNNKILEKYNLYQGFYSGIKNIFPGSGYIDFYEDNLFILSSRGVLAYKNKIEDEYVFKQIKNNINNFIHINQFKKDISFSLKDLFIKKDKIFISYTEEIKEDCWNTSIIFGNINYENIQFRKLFSSKECIHSINNIDKEFDPHQSGGKIISFDDNYILLSVGDYRSRFLAQNKKSVNGKILKINIKNNDYQIISMGHRNPQGLYLDKENNLILETEHGPMGGDEINLIDIKKINKEKILNYGWPIASAGEHYNGKEFYLNKKKYEKYPLYKSHSAYGFIEPIKSFVPSIGISEIAKISKNKYVLSSLKDKSLYFFELNDERKVINLDRVEVFERIRDLKFSDNKLYLFMEDTASIGVISFN